jgi:hypothetical protein
LKSTSAVKRAKPVRAANNNRRIRSEKIWLKDRTATRQDFIAIREFAVRSPALLNVPALMFSALSSISTLSL